jgi:hypothetical protein
MDTACLDHVLTDAERSSFDERGFFIVENAVPDDFRLRLIEGVDKVYAQERANGLGPYENLFYPNFLPEHGSFVELVDWPTTFPKVWGILGWNIYSYHCHLGVTPPLSPDAPRDKQRLGWHQDSGRVNREMEFHPRPRLSLKIAFVLSDLSEPGRANFCIVPGRQLEDELTFPEDETANPPEAMPVCAPAGSAVFFDRRLWHSASPNHSDITRKILFLGYSYRWLRPKDNFEVDALREQSPPIRAQLLGAGDGANNFYNPEEGTVPLKEWLKEHAPDQLDPARPTHAV